MFSTNGIYQIWLRTTGNYTVEQVNYIPTSQAGFGIVCTLILGWYSDWDTSRRWHVGFILTGTAIITGALMLNPPNEAAKFAALILNGAQYAGQTVMFAWCNDLTRHDDAKRAVIISSMNMVSTSIICNRLGSSLTCESSSLLQFTCGGALSSTMRLRLQTGGRVASPCSAWLPSWALSQEAVFGVKSGRNAKRLVREAAALLTIPRRRLRSWILRAKLRLEIDQWRGYTCTDQQKCQYEQMKILLY
jgi:hypothetical protein